MKRLSIVGTVLCSWAVLLVAACGGTPEEKMARYRGMYQARLNGFIVQKPEPPEPEMPAEAEEGGEATAAAAAAEADAEEGEGEGEEMMEPEPPPANPNILLDILIQHDSPEILPGVTVDISMVDADENPKSSWRVWFDTSKVRKANITPYTHVLEDVEYEEGDGFSAEIRHPVPPEDRGEYKEFSAAG